MNDSKVTILRRRSQLATVAAFVALLFLYTSIVTLLICGKSSIKTTPLLLSLANITKIETSKPDSMEDTVRTQETRIFRNKTVETRIATIAAKPHCYPKFTLTRNMYTTGHELPHPDLCPNYGTNLRLLIAVTSAPSHFKSRNGVRLTWGHYGKRRDIALAFFIGKPPKSLHPALDAEDALYGDLVIGRSLDSYSNLTLKTLSILEWVDTYCPRLSYLLKTDDDMFINVPQLLHFINLHGNATKTIWGKVHRKPAPIRFKSKHYISHRQFPKQMFPDYTTGPAYLLTVDTVRPLLEAAPSEPYLRLEDVFVTGLLASRLNIKRIHAPIFYSDRVIMHACDVQRIIGIHMVQYHEQFTLWRKLLDGKTKCATGLPAHL